MLKLYNKEHEVLSALTNLKDYKIEYVLSGEDLLEFSLSRYDENIPLIQEECYIRTEYNEYVIKAIEPSDNFKRFTCNINIESLVGKVIKNFDTKNNNINDTIRLAIAGTGWTLADNSISKKRTVSLKNTNALEVLRKVRETFRVDFRFDAINKIIYVYEKLGSDKGVYFTDELNLISLDVPSDSYDYATRLYAKGKDGLTFADINDGKDYIENFQYSNKIIEKIWEDNRYTNKQNLKEDAEAKLEELSKPRRNYNVQVYDLAKNNSEFSFLDFSIGDTVTIISNLEKFKDKQRIVKYIEYPEDPSQNTCELGNTTLTFEELQKANEAKNQVVENITSDNGTVDGSKVDSITTEQISDFEAEVAKITDLTVVNAEITNLKAQNVTITGKLNAIEGEFGTIKANVGVIENLTVNHTAKINDLIANKASITQLEAVSAKIGTVEADVGKINTLLAGNLTGGNIQAGGITSDKLTIANGFITNAMIANLDVSKVNAGDISTNKFRIKSDNGGIEIVGATQQFKDKNNKVRIQMGQDTQGNFNFIIRGEDGTSVLIDHTGIKEKAIADDLIKETMIAQDAIGEKQINYSSFITGFNKDTNTNTIKSTKIMLNNQNQTLDVAFSQLKTQSDGTKSLTESHSTTIGVMQGQISTAINNTQIVKDGQTILLKDDYNRTVQTIDSMKSTIGSHTSQIDGLNSTVSTQGSSISQLKNQIALKVEQTDITTAINNMNIGGENIFLNANFAKRTTKTNIGWDNSKNGTTLANSWSCYNSVVENPSTGYHAHLYQKDGEWVARYVNESDKRWKSFTQSLSDYSKKQLVPGEKYTFSVDIYSENTGCYLHGGLHSYRKGDTNRAFNSGTYGLQPTVLNKWVRMSWTFTVHSDIDLSKDMAWYIYGYQGSVGTIYMKKPQLQRGTKATDFNISQEDNDNSIANVQTQITSTSNKVATIETNLSSITSRVSSTETTLSSTTATANSALSKANSAQTTANSANSLANTANNTANANKSSISSLTTRVSTAESKLTKDSLTTTIGSYYTTSTDVNGIVTSKGYQTASQVQQTVNAFELKFQESGGYNLVYNSDFKNGDHLWSISSGAKYYFGTGNWNSPTGLGMAITGQSGTSLYAVQELTNTSYRQAKTFTLSGLVNISSTGTNDSTGAKFQLYVRVTYDDDTKKYHMCNIDESSLNKWQKVFVTFNLDTTKTVTDLRTTVSIQNTTKTIFVSQIMLEVGSMMSPWCPNSSEVYDGVTTIDKEGITVTASNVKSKTTISANGFKITKTDTNTDVFKVNSDGRLSLIGDYTAYNGNRKAGYFGMNEIKFYNWWSDTNEEIATIYGGKDSSNRRSANMVGRDTVALGVGTASSGSKVLESTSSKLSIYKDTDFGGGALTNVRKLNYDVTYDTWINRLYIRSNQINTNMSSGYLHFNYWKGGNTTSTSTHVKIGNGNNDDANGALTCGNFKATGTKNCIVETTVGYVGINAYETADCYFGDIGETILDSEGYSYVYIDSIFSETVNTERKYQVFLSVYGEGSANVVERTPIYFVIKGTPGIEVGYELKAKRKGYEDHRLEREVNNWKIGENHGLDEEYNHERVDFDKKIENIINEEVIKDIENETLQEFISSEVERSIENIELLKTIEEDILNEDIN